MWRVSHSLQGKQMKKLFVLVCFVSVLVLVAGCSDSTSEADFDTVYVNLLGTSQECGSIQQDANDASNADSNPKPGNCSGQLLRVPEDCPTIQQAVNVAPQEPMDAPPAFQTVIVLADGEYKNFVVPERVSVMVIGENSSSTIDGGTGIAIDVGDQGEFMLQGVTVRNTKSEQSGFFPTIRTGWLTNVYLDSVTILTESTGLLGMSSYPVIVTNSTIIGNGTTFKKGIDLGQSMLIDSVAAARIYSNKFRNLDWGISVCKGKEPLLGVNDSFDSNQYEQVKLLAVFYGQACQ